MISLCSVAGMRILHLSDTHLDRVDGPNGHGVNARESLRRILEDCREVQNIDVVVVSGDLADDGSREAYIDVLELVGGFASERRVPTIFSTGNHDERQAFTKVLGSGHVDAAGADRPADLFSSVDGERAATSQVAGYRFVTLDSLVPGKGYGRISQAQLDWLREVLAEPAPNGTILAFHHPPIALDVEVQRALGLRNAGDLAEAIRGKDVRLILCGHFHLQIFGHLELTPVWVTPGVVNRIDLTAVPGTERAVRGASATVVDLGGPHSPLLHVLHARDPHVGQTVYELDNDQLGAVIAKLCH
jgi:3',5'-cyclic AMP phosphodiesterase CpdA